MKELNVLLVEDNLLNQKFAFAILKSEKHRTDIAANGSIALDLFKKNRYDLILMDIQMPVMDGLNAAKLIRQIEKKRKSKPVPIIAVTAFAVEGDESKIYNAGMDDILRKPFKAEQLIELLNQMFS